MKSLLLAALLMFDVELLPPERMESMKRTSWHEGCPVPLADLRLLKITYLDYSGKRASGELIVHRDLAEETESIFRELYDHHFPIEKIAPVDAYAGNDDRSMEANNTSAFNCRDKIGQPGSFSNHSWGRAIDINPLTNPYVKGNAVFPPAGRA
jgi:hypothetical protein